MQPSSFDQFLLFMKQHGFNFDGIVASFVGALIAAGLLPKLSIRQAAFVLICGVATNVYVVPLVFWTLGLNTESSIARTAAFLSGLLGMRVMVVFATAAQTAKSPRDFLDMFLQGTTNKAGGIGQHDPPPTSPPPPPPPPEPRP